MTTEAALNSALQNTQSNSRTSSNSDTVGLAEDFDDFLNLLTTQLQNQDPTEPLKTKEFTNQLVQFSQVEQSINMNSKLDELISLQQRDPLSTAASFIGKQASYEGSEFFFDGESPAELQYSLNNPSIDTQIVIRDQFGTEVYRTGGRTGAGAHDFEWDGTDMAGNPVGPGTYSVGVQAIDGDGNLVQTATLVKGLVRGIESDGNQTFLLIGERAIPQDLILRIENPDDIPTSEDQATQ